MADCPDSSHTAFGSSADEQGCRTWSSWGPWSSCSTPCGTGSMSRYRTCPPGDSLRRCWGQDIQRQQCFNTTCPGKQITVKFTNFIFYNIIFLNILIKICLLSSPVDGQWLPWGRWSNCSSSCGGVQVRQRECIPPQYGGLHCSQFEGPANLSLEFSKSSSQIVECANLLLMLQAFTKLWCSTDFMTKTHYFMY